MDIGRKIVMIRKNKGISQKKLAQMLNWDPSNLVRIEKGRVIPSLKSIEEIAEKLEVPPSYLIDNNGFPPKIPVVSFASAGEAVNFTDQGYPQGGGMYFIDRPANFSDPNGFGIEVSGDSMVPKYEDGQVVLVDTRKCPQSGDYAVVGLMNGDKYIKRYREAQGVVILESVNPLYEPIVVQKDEIRFAYKIVWVKER
ncbi:MAG: XRE family transcriptional regulator [Acidobacteriota bacterium]|nr:helix-turn-helix transcriptional regulator [Thermoanaerobaculaceae bacterium]